MSSSTTLKVTEEHGQLHFLALSHFPNLLDVRRVPAFDFSQARRPLIFYRRSATPNSLHPYNIHILHFAHAPCPSTNKKLTQSGNMSCDTFSPGTFVLQCCCRAHPSMSLFLAQLHSSLLPSASSAIGMNCNYTHTYASCASMHQAPNVPIFQARALGVSSFMSIHKLV